MHNMSGPIHSRNFTDTYSTRGHAICEVRYPNLRNVSLFPIRSHQNRADVEPPHAHVVQWLVWALGCEV